MRFTRRLVMFAALAAVVLVAGATLAAQDSRQAQAQLKAAQQLEEVKGDLAGAMEIYEKLSTSSDRAIAPQALLGLARCQEKLGLSEAPATLQKLIADYPEQTAAVAEARRRLDSRTSAIGAQSRQRLLFTLEPTAWFTGRMPDNGRFVTFTHSFSGRPELFVRDLTTGVERAVARANSECTIPESALSRDGRWLAFRALCNTKAQLLIADLAQPGFPRSRLLLETPLRGAVPFDWSPDGQWIAVSFLKDDGASEYALVSVTDGATRVLKTLSGPRPGGGFFSPDGRLLAVGIPGQGARTPEAPDEDITLLAVTGGQETPVVVNRGHDSVMGWTPDGSGLLFSSARSGTQGLWLQRISDGRPTGQPEQVLSGFGHAEWSLGVTSGGALYSRERMAERRVMEGQFDWNTGTFAVSPRDVPESHVQSNERPRYSPDGKHLGFVSTRPDPWSPSRVLVVRSLETGAVREVPIGFRLYNTDLWRWMPNGRAVALIGEPLADGVPVPARNGLYTIDLESGEVATIVLAPRSVRVNGAVTSGVTIPEFSTDGRTMFYNRAVSEAAAGSVASIVRVTRDLESGREMEAAASPDGASAIASLDGHRTYELRTVVGARVVVERDANGSEKELARLFGNPTWRLTPDGRQVIAATIDPVTNEGLVVSYSTADGSQQILLRARRNELTTLSNLGPGTPAVLVSISDGAYGSWWWVPTDGRPARKVPELDGNALKGWVGSLQLHPDGRRLAFALSSQRVEHLWVLENFLPAVKR